MREYRRPIASVLCLALLGLLPRLAAADAVDHLVKREMELRRIPGISLAIVQKGEVTKLAAYGLANLEHNVPVTDQTVFQIQSMTKSFTAAGILLLMEEGKLSLTDPVSRHLDGTPESWKEITLRHLLTHTSGIKDFINEPTASLRLDVSEEQVLKDTAPRPLNFPPGQRYAYSNTNYHLLAMIIRRHTGKSYGEFLRDRIFQPLGMRSTRICSLTDVIPHRASGYIFANGAMQNGEFVAESILSYGGGGIISTVSDMAKWAIAFEGGKVLKPSTRDLAWTACTFNDGKSGPYGLGWAVDAAEKHRIFSHGGGHITGFTSNLAIFPDDELAVVVLTNARHANPGRLARRIAGLYVPALAPQPAKAIEDKEPAVTAMLRDCATHMLDWKLPQEKFTPDLWQVISSQRLAMQATAIALGRLEKLELLSRSEADGVRTYRYRLSFANGSFIAAMELDKEGRISMLNVEPE